MERGVWGRRFGVSSFEFRVVGEARSAYRVRRAESGRAEARTTNGEHLRGREDTGRVRVWGSRFLLPFRTPQFALPLRIYIPALDILCIDNVNTWHGQQPYSL